ncbi:prohead protease/major capsid protein fusion protein [Ancylobacter polymorphus]|uniref:HK97 family phage prohead protease n=1 Tax=Ancylobacter polymorphus TaxID=223390 RepID=A0ABU0B638_9HYPH|nr:prohead protease/major capsid protein fusion protein [Ancylobacter polymorphus]MDQ0301280.1 HK97 family phage prohead protease [Ancylobacter polymorphus]
MNDLVTRFAPLASAGATTFDPETRTMQAVIAAGAEVERYDARGAYIEILDHGGMVLPASGSVPLLDNHRRSGLADVLGSAKDITARGTTIEATLTLSRREDVSAIAQDIADGHVRGTSIGYRVLAREEKTDAAGRRRVTATKWELAEVSLVPIPADPNAAIRSEAPMPEHNDEQNVNDLSARAAINAEIRAVGALAGLDQAWVDGQIDAGASADAARSAAFAAMQARSPAPIQTARASVGQDHADPAAIRSAMGDALAHRMAPNRVKLEGRAAEFRALDLLGMVGDLAQARGERINLRDRGALIERAVGAHSTSDFPLLLADAANKSLLANYAAAEPTYRRWSAQRPFADFRDHSFLRVGDFPKFTDTVENGGVKFGTISENREKVKAKQLDAGIAIGRQALLNDDLSALADFSSMIAIRAASDENARVYGLLAANAALSDGVALFHANHGNLAASGSGINDYLHAAIAAIRKQKGLDGVSLNLAPRFLIVGPDNEKAARQVVTAITPSKATDVNPWGGLLEVVVDANIAGTEWYVAVDPATAPSVVFGYVGNANGPEIRTEIDFDTRAVKVAAGLDFGCGVIDFRGLYKNPGS